MTLAMMPFARAAVLQVFKEAMRLYPPVYITARSAVRDIELRLHHRHQEMIAKALRDDIIPLNWRGIIICQTSLVRAMRRE